MVTLTSVFYLWVLPGSTLAACSADSLLVLV